MLLIWSTNIKQELKKKLKLLHASKKFKGQIFSKTHLVHPIEEALLVG